MTYAKQWDVTSVQEALTTESRQKNRDLFLRTHSPFRRIRVDFCKEAGNYGGFVTEDEVREIIHAAPLSASNRLFFVVGEAGSGKSEMCQWLEYTADTTSRIPIHIPRSMTRAMHVASLLRQRLRDTSSLRDTPLAPPRARAQHAALTAVMLLYERGHSVLQPAATWEPILTSEELVERLTQALVQADDVSARTIRLLDAESLRRLCSQHQVNAPEAQVSTIAQALDNLLWQALDQALWLGDLRSLLGELSKRAIAEGARPLLLIEDLTAFQAMGDLLLDYLLDLTSGHFDAVIGVTTGFERDQLARATLDGDLTHIRHRLRARFVLTDEAGHAYSLENTVVEFALAYLRAVKASSVHPTGATGTDTPFGGELYPFTEVALQRAFSCLREEGNVRQTPRLFIEHVLAAVLLADDLPSHTLDRSTFLERPPALFRRGEVADERLQSLLRWYGTVEDDAVTLDSRIAEAWGIGAPTELQTRGYVRAPRSYSRTSPGGAVIGDDGWQQEVSDLQRWMDGGGLYPSRESLKRGVEQVLLQLGDPRSLASRESLSLAQGEIYYARGGERLPVYLEDDSGDALGEDAYVKVHITRAPEERAILEELVYYALSGAELAETSENIALTLAWAQERWDSYHAQVRSLLTTSLNGITAEQLIFVTWRLVCSLAGSSWTTWPNMGAKDAELPPYIDTTPWDATAHDRCFRAGEALYRWYETARRLFIGAFMYRDTLVDLQRFSSTASSIDVNVVLGQLARLSMAVLRSLPFKIRPANVGLHDLLVPLQRYAAALAQFDVARAWKADLDDALQCARHLEHQLNMDFGALRTQASSLRWRCGQVGATWRDNWDSAIETLNALSQDELSKLYTEVCDVVDGISQRLQEEVGSIWDYQDFRCRVRRVFEHRYWAAEATLRNICDDLDRAARERFPGNSRTLTGTRRYRELLATLRAVHEEVTHAGTAAR